MPPFVSTAAAALLVVKGIYAKLAWKMRALNGSCNCLAHSGDTAVYTLYRCTLNHGIVDYHTAVWRNGGDSVLLLLCLVPSVSSSPCCDVLLLDVGIECLPKQIQKREQISLSLSLCLSVYVCVIVCVLCVLSSH